MIVKLLLVCVRNKEMKWMKRQKKQKGGEEVMQQPAAVCSVRPHQKAECMKITINARHCRRS